MPGRWLSQYSLWNGGSVPSCWVTSYCRAASVRRRSASLGFWKVMGSHPLDLLWAHAPRAADVNASAAMTSTRSSGRLMFMLLDREPHRVDHGRLQRNVLPVSHDGDHAMRAGLEGVEHELGLPPAELQNPGHASGNRVVGRRKDAGDALFYACPRVSLSPPDAGCWARAPVRPRHLPVAWKSGSRVPPTPRKRSPSTSRRVIRPSAAGRCCSSSTRGGGLCSGSRCFKMPLPGSAGSS